MTEPDAERLLKAFRRAAAHVPAYRALLDEAGVDPASVRRPADVARLPLLDKANTFRRFPLRDLCVGGRIPHPSAVLTSSGHSGVFAFGLSSLADEATLAARIDDLLDYLFAVRTRPTLLVNALPMGVKIRTLACSLGETSVRPDMALGLVRGFAEDFDQVILVGEAAFVKRLLEDGERGGVDWRRLRVHVIVGEEPLAENARKCIERMLGSGPGDVETGLVCSSMGIGEVGLNLFFEVPPVAPLIRLRRALHDDADLRQAVLGPATTVPMLFTYDPSRIGVEFTDGGRLVLSTLDPGLPIPLIRYAPGDHGAFLALPSRLYPILEKAGLPADVLASLPIVVIQGRGRCVRAAGGRVDPEQVKEGLYHEADLARLTTANFRLAGGAEAATVRVQLSPGAAPDAVTAARFEEAVARYAGGPVRVACEPYEAFGSGMALDYERKFDYLGP